MAHERMSQYAPRRAEEQAGRLQATYGRAREVVGDHAGYSALLCFGIGLGVGAALTLILAPEKKHKAWNPSCLPDSRRATEMADRVRETVNHILPDALARHFKVSAKSG